MAQETLMVNPDEDLDVIINRLRQVRSKDVMVVLPNKTRALETLDQFNALRRVVRDENIKLTISGGNKTAQGLAKLLGFQIDKGEGTGAVATSPADSDADELPSLFSTLNDPATQQPSKGNFGGPPSGFVVSNGASSPQPTMPLETPQPPRTSRNPQDLFNAMGNFQPPEMPTRPVPPPPSGGTSGGFQGLDDIPLNRANAADLFGSSPTMAPPPSTGAGFDTTGGRTFSYEEAMRQGLMADEAPTRIPGDGPSGFDFNLPDDSDDDVPSVLPTGGDNAASAFRPPTGVRRGRGNDTGDTRGGRRGRSNNAAADPTMAGTPKPRRNISLSAGTAALSGLNFSRFFRGKPKAAPVESANRIGRAPLPPEIQREREREKSRYGMYAFIGVIAAFLLVLVLLLLTVTSGGNKPGTGAGDVQATRVNLIVYTQQVTSTAQILLDTSAPVTTPPTTAVSGNSSTTNPTDQAAAGSPGRLSVKEVNTNKITKNGEWPAFGSQKRADGTAQGQVTLYNGGLSARSYGAGTVLYTNTKTGVQYKLVSAVTIPASDPPRSFGQATAVVQASQAGPLGNLDAIGRVTLDAAVSASVGKIEGGTERTVKVVSDQDRNALKTQLVEDARNQAKKELEGQYDPTTQGIQFLNTAEPECQFDKKTGDVADKFSGTCSVAARAIIYNKASLSDAVKNTLLQNPQQIIDPNSLKFTGDGQVKEENGRLIYTVPVSGMLYQPLTDADKQKIAGLLAGKTPEDGRVAVMSVYDKQLMDIDFGDFKGTLPADTTKFDLRPVYDYEFVKPAAGTPTSAGSPVAPQTTAK